MKYVNERNTPCIVRVEGEAKVLQPGEGILSDICLLKYGLKAIPQTSAKKSTKKNLITPKK
tara:strand:- start:347 stop:529 length:183 start_codon:yes stop_codon:yes gene_type:complete